MLASIEGPVHAVSYSYEPNRDLMSSIDNKAGNLTGSSISKYTYQHDALNRRTDRTQSGSAIATASTDTFSYNPRNEVIGSENDIATAAVWNPSYTYDPIGNRLTSTGFIESSYVTNELNQYTELSVSSPPREPVHDEDGNLIDNGDGWTYVWNGENRLIQATNGTTTIDFTYDYQGRLVKKDDGTDVKVYVYDDWNRIATFLHNSSFNLHNSYVWGIDLSGSMQGAGGVGGLLKEGDLYPLYDANGNIMQKLDDTGSIAMNVAYDPFGNIIDGTLVGEYGFSTKPLIDDLNWYYYGFRYYDPETGRWLNRDPIEEQGGLNLYGFVLNDPVNWWDLLGLRHKCPKGKRTNCVTGGVFRRSPTTEELEIRALAAIDAAERTSTVAAAADRITGAVTRNPAQIAYGTANADSSPFQAARDFIANIGTPYSDDLARKANDAGIKIQLDMFVTIFYWECESYCLGLRTKWNTGKSININCGSGVSESACRRAALRSVCP